MTAQERDLLLGFLQQLRQTQAGQKDPAADDLIKEAVAAKPDAAYLLVQRALALEYALEATKAELAAAQAELQRAQAAPAGGGFPGQGASWGRSGKAPAGAVAAAPAAMTPAVSPGSFGRQAAPAAAATAAPSAPSAPSAGGGGLLGTVAGTAAGVVAGSFLFQGIQGLLGQHGQRDANADHARAADAVPPPAMPPEQFAPTGAELDTAALDAGYFDSGDGGDSA